MARGDAHRLGRDPAGGARCERAGHAHCSGILGGQRRPERSATWPHDPMRVVPIGEGCESIFVLIRQRGMSDEKLAEYRAAVERDRRTLKELMEQPEQQRQ